MPDGKKNQQEENKDQQNPERKAESKNEVVLSSKSFFAEIIDVYSSSTQIKKTSAYFNIKPIDRSLDIFHPPSYQI